MLKNQKGLSTLIIIVSIVVFVVGGFFVYRYVSRESLKRQGSKYISINYPDFKIIHSEYTPYSMGLDGDSPARYEFTIQKKTNSEIVFNVDYKGDINDLGRYNEGHFSIRQIYRRNFKRYNFSEKAKDNLYKMAKRFSDVDSVDIYQYIHTFEHIHDMFLPAIQQDHDIYPERVMDNYFVFDNKLYYLENDNWIVVNS
ncbi:hypothetical protein KBB76_01430 [Candidatus Saccharibacteria bacterium]|nr:hypothetical protein [Candidatus Saccharibacteria bacterium]